MRLSFLKILFPVLFTGGIVSGTMGLYNITHVRELEYPEIAIDEYVQKSDTYNIDSENSSEDIVTITALSEVNVNVADDTVELFYDNPLSNNMNARVSLKVNDIVIAESGLIEPGYSLYEMHDLNIQDLAYGTHTGELIIDSFDPKTGERSIVNNSISVDVQINA